MSFEDDPRYVRYQKRCTIGRDRAGLRLFTMDGEEPFPFFTTGPVTIVDRVSRSGQLLHSEVTVTLVVGSVETNDPEISRVSKALP